MGAMGAAEAHRGGACGGDHLGGALRGGGPAADGRQALQIGQTANSPGADGIEKRVLPDARARDLARSVGGGRDRRGEEWGESVFWKGGEENFGKFMLNRKSRPHFARKQVQYLHWLCSSFASDIAHVIRTVLVSRVAAQNRNNSFPYNYDVAASAPILVLFCTLAIKRTPRGLSAMLLNPECISVSAGVYLLISGGIGLR